MSNHRTLQLNSVLSPLAAIGLIVLVAFGFLVTCSRSESSPVVSIGATLPELPLDAALDTIKSRLYGQSLAMARAMSDEHLAGQVLMIGLPDVGGLSRRSGELLRQLAPGALLLFRYNVPSGAAAIQTLCLALQTAVGEVPAFLAIDHEGGTVFRFGNEVTALPAARVLGAAALAFELAALTGRIAGSELGALGFSMNLAPVVEAAAGPSAGFLSSRAWSDDPWRAADLGAAYILAQQAAGLPAVAKHFPGTADVDPHYGLARLAVSAADLDAQYVQPFARVLAAEPAAVVLSHVIVSALEAELPAPFSPVLVQDTLKQAMGFAGIVISDDMVMKALAGSGSMTDRALKALLAGVDMVMVSSLAEAGMVRDGLIAALRDGQLSRERLVDAVQRILYQKMRFGQLADSVRNQAARDLDSYDRLVADNRLALRQLLQP